MFYFEYRLLLYPCVQEITLPIVEASRVAMQHFDILNGSFPWQLLQKQKTVCSVTKISMQESSVDREHPMVNPSLLLECHVFWLTYVDAYLLSECLLYIEPSGDLTREIKGWRRWGVWLHFLGGRRESDPGELVGVFPAWAHGSQIIFAVYW